MALAFGKIVGDSSFGMEHLKLSPKLITIAIGLYGFVASVLPVWLLLCPRDYLSSYLKLGTIALLVVGVVVVNPPIQMPSVTKWAHGGGPVVPGPIFPFVFITIACGAISGFHALVSSGTTPKMVDKETDCRPIGYGAMLMEGLVGVTALVAACVVPQDDWVAINTNPPVKVVASAHGEGLARSREELERAGAVLTPHDRDLLGLKKDEAIDVAASRTLKASQALALSNGTLAALGYHVDPSAPRATTLDDADFARLGIHVKELPALSQTSGEVVAARTGGGVSLAVGMARVFSGLPGMNTLLAYWYHFAIMFEALFILTAIDTGTRIGRFLLQELLARASPDLGRMDNKVGTVLSSVFIVGSFSALIWTSSIQTLWPMFGVANQLLACAALAVASTVLLKDAPKRIHALVTIVPLVFVATTTITGGVESIRIIYLPMIKNPEKQAMGLVNTSITAALLFCVGLVLVGSLLRWVRIPVRVKQTA
jgi:carbon starvation protein